MDKINLVNDIKIFYVTAASFPAGIMDAQEQLYAIVPFSPDRKFFGVSRPEDGNGIVYRAGAEEKKQGEAESLHCETLTIFKGQYISLTVTNYQDDVQAITRAFEQLLMHPHLDPQGYCVECYMSDRTTVNCMIRLAD
ncbi:MAG: transcriptional regulator [Bacteroidota bacterium]